MLHVTAVKGLVEETVKPSNDCSRHKLNLFNRSTSRRGSIRSRSGGDIDRFHKWLAGMIEGRIAPDEYIYAILAKGFSSRNITSFSTPEKDKFHLNSKGHISVILFLARTGDSVEVERMYR